MISLLIGLLAYLVYRCTLLEWALNEKLRFNVLFKVFLGSNHLIQFSWKLLWESFFTQMWTCQEMISNWFMQLIFDKYYSSVILSFSFFVLSIEVLYWFNSFGKLLNQLHFRITPHQLFLKLTKIKIKDVRDTRVFGKSQMWNVSMVLLPL